MRYYKIDDDLDTMGIVPQSNSVRIEERIPIDMVVYSDFHEGRDKKKLFAQPIMLVRQANLTDYISTVNINTDLGMHAISNKMYSILTRFNLPTHKVQNVIVVTRDKTEHKNYVILYEIELWPPNPIDYNETIFRHESAGLHKGDWEKQRLYNVASKDAYEYKLKELKKKFKGQVNRLIFEKVSLLKEFSLDFFRIINGISVVKVISEKLKDAMEADGITGLAYEEIYWLHNYDEL